MKRLIPLALLLTLGGCASFNEMLPDEDSSQYEPLQLDYSVPPSTGGGLFRSGYSGSLTGDKRAVRVGDILTVVLDESTQSSKSAGTSFGKSSGVSVGIPTVLGNTYDPIAAPLAAASGGPMQEFPVHPLFVSNDPAPLQGAMLCGEGLMFSSDVTIKPFVESGQAVRVLGGWVGPVVDFNAVFTRGRVPSPKVRAFVDFLVERLSFDVNYMQKSCPSLCKSQAAEPLQLPVVEALPDVAARVRKVAALA